VTDRVAVSVVMPCLNEAATLARSIVRAKEGLARLGREGEIVVADNGSTDGSVAIAREAGARVVHVSPRGYGNAYRGGIGAARGEIVVIGDSDDTYDFTRLEELVARVDAGADLVLGSRLLGDIAPGAMPWLHRYVGNPLLSATLNFFYRTRVVDTHSGFRAFRREAYERLALRTGGMEFASEMLIAAARGGWRIEEIPISYLPREGESKLRTFRDGWRHLRLLLLYSPTHLFTAPGLVLSILGLVLLVALAGGPLSIGRLHLDYHVMFLGAALAILGTELSLLGLFARSWKTPPRWFTLERGLVAGAIVFVAGFVLNLLILWQWIASGFGQLMEVRRAILGLTLMVVGAQLAFGAFFLDLVRSRSDHSAAPPLVTEDAPS